MKPTNVFLSDDIRARLFAKARFRNVSIAKLVRIAVEEWLERQEADKPVQLEPPVDEAEFIEPGWEKNA